MTVQTLHPVIASSSRLVLLGDFGDRQVCPSSVISSSRCAAARSASSVCDKVQHTRGQGLLQLLGLVGILEHQGVQVLLAADLELDVADLLVLLDARGCETLVFMAPVVSPHAVDGRGSFARKRTGGVLPTADLDELSQVSIAFF